MLGSGRSGLFVSCRFCSNNQTTRSWDCVLKLSLEVEFDEKIKIQMERPAGKFFFSCQTCSWFAGVGAKARCVASVCTRTQRCSHVVGSKSWDVLHLFA